MPHATLYTIGYQGLDIQTFITALQAAGIQLLADVRAVARSRKPGFAKTALARHLAEAGIAYQDFAALGTPQAGRAAAKHHDRAAFAAIYEAHLQTPAAQAALADLAKAAQAQVTCLLCFERDPTVCHRTMIAQRLEQSDLRPATLYG